MDFEDNNPLSAVRSPGPSRTESFCKDIDRPAVPTVDAPIAVIDAGKSREGTKNRHISYTIRVPGGPNVRRRYSDFESLRKVLRRMFPTIVAPCIPEKHPWSAYAASPAHAHEDQSVIEHRQRMLTSFLVRCWEIPVLRTSQLFAYFLDPMASWAEVMASNLVLKLPQSPLLAPPDNALNHTPAHAHLPVPASGSKLESDPCPELKMAEDQIKEYETLVSTGLNLSTNRVIVRLKSLGDDCADLGSKFNLFSIEISPSVARAVEHVGQTIDTAYLATERLQNALVIGFSEPLHESGQLAATARQVLKYRRYRAAQVEMTKEALNTRRNELTDLESAEREVQRISTYLHADERISSAVQGTAVAGAAAAQGGPSDLSETPQEFTPPDTVQGVQSNPPKRGKGFRLPGLSQINHALHGMMDADPEISRRASISKTHVRISNLEAALEVAKRDSKAADEAVTLELERYKSTKKADLHKLVRAFVQSHFDWAQRNLASWEETRLSLG